MISYVGKLIRNPSFYFFLTFFFFLGCLQKNENQYQFWTGYLSLQKAIQASTTNEVLFQALNGIANNLISKELKTNDQGNLFLTLSGSKQGLSNWKIDWYGKKDKSTDYYAEVEFIPQNWDEKEIYSVERTVSHNLQGYKPSDFFRWLNGFVLLANQHNEYYEFRNKSENLKFLCGTLACQITETSESQLLEFTLNETTKTKFPGFYNRSGARLEKSKINVIIWDPSNPKYKLRIANHGRTLQFYLPVNPPKDLFLKPKEIRFLGDIEIKSFGITLNLHNLEYKLKADWKPNEDILQGKFVRLGKKEISGRFLYFIPTGVLDFFIPGNLDEYLSDAMTLMVTGTQGRGGNQFQASFRYDGKSQTTNFKTYAEVMRKRFSLFGSEDSQKISQDFEFYAAWEAAMMKDLK